MKSVILIWVAAITISVTGLAVMNHAINELCRLSMAAIKQEQDWSPIPPNVAVEPYSVSALPFSDPIDIEDGITEPFDIQPAGGYRLIQPTLQVGFAFSPQMAARL